MAYVGWELALNMKCTRCPCPNPSCSRIPKSRFMLELPGQCSNTDCWAPSQSFWINRSQGRAWESASLTSSQVILPLIWGPRLENHWSDVQSGHWDFKKQTKWFQCAATVDIHFHILLLSCSEKTTGSIFWTTNFINRIVLHKLSLNSFSFNIYSFFRYCWCGSLLLFPSSPCSIRSSKSANLT